MSDARPSGPQTAVCHNNHRRMTWTQRDKTTMKQEKTKGNRQTEIKVREQKCVFSVCPKAYFNLSARSTQQVHKCALSFFPPIFFLSLFCLSLFYHFFLVLTSLVSVLSSALAALKAEKTDISRAFSLVSLTPLC